MTELMQSELPTVDPRQSSLRGKQIAVTGADGFIGRHLVRSLIEAGAGRVVAIDSRPIASTRLPTSSSTFIGAGGRTILEPIDDLLEGIEVVVHLAAQVSPPKSVKDPLSDATANVLATVALLESCRRAGVKRLIYASSAAVYGRPIHLPIDEEHRTCPESPYGQSKLAAEHYCLLYARLYGLSVVALRYFSVYGPGQPLSGGYAGVIRLFLDRLDRGLPLQIEGDGSQTRDFIHVSDIARANLLATGSSVEGILNVASGEGITIADVAHLVAGPDYPIEYLPPRLGDIPHSVANVEAAHRQLGFQTTVSLADGLADLRKGAS